MYAREHRVLLRHYLEQGLSKTAIARSLHVSRRTVYHWITTGQLDRDLDEGPVQYTPRPPVGARLHRTTGEVPQARFERDERAMLQALAPRPYRSVVPLLPVPALQPSLPGLPSVERRSLTIYSRIAGVRT